MWLRKQKRNNYDNNHEDAKLVQHNYDFGHYAYILRGGNHRKLEGDKLRQLRIKNVYTNGFIRIQRETVNEQINILRLTPHFGYPPT